MAGIDFEARPVQIDESPRPGEDGLAIASRLARDKAEAGLEDDSESVVLAADTVVSCGGEPQGKPRNYEDFVAMMREISGASHNVISGVCVMSRDRRTAFQSVTEVVFDVLPPAWIQAYWASGEPKDKAGGYAIQGMAGSRVREIRGSYTNVVGLPLCESCAVLSEFGILPDFMSASRR